MKMKRVFGLAVAAGLSVQGATVFSANGSAAGILPTVNAFRSALGGLNPPGTCSPAPCTSGRREINWDVVPASAFDPFPGGFFNANGAPADRTLGVSLETPGTLAVSDNSFGFPGDFPPFSADRIFGVRNSTIVDVFFHVPGSPSSTAGTLGFGVIFLDVELPGTTMEFFDVSTNLSLGKFDVPTGQNASFSFLGVTFAPGQVGRVRLSLGDGGMVGSTTGACTLDCVAVDDFIYGEPLNAVPEPSSALLILAGGVALIAVRRRK